MAMAVLRAVPTVYHGVRYRSRTEARFAVCMDSWGWSYSYEPSDFNVGNYVPDFLVEDAHKNERIIELKPALISEDFAATVSRRFERIRFFDPDVFTELWCVDFFNKQAAAVRCLTGNKVAEVCCGFDEDWFGAGVHYRFDLESGGALNDAH